MMIYKLAGEAFPDIKIPELTAFYEELEKWSDIFGGRPKWRRVKRSGGLVRGSERMVNMLNTGKILCDEETARQEYEKIISESRVSAGMTDLLALSEAE